MGSRRSAGPDGSSSPSTARPERSRTSARSRRPQEGASSTSRPLRSLTTGRTSWADFHRPIEVSGRIGVRPSWWDPKEGLIDVVVDPGRAFGTGGHPTTRLCLGLLVTLGGGRRGIRADRRLGYRQSGVLGISAAKLGWSPVTGCDRELAALETAKANAEANGVEMSIERVDVREGAPPGGARPSSRT